MPCACLYPCLPSHRPAPPEPKPTGDEAHEQQAIEATDNASPNAVSAAKLCRNAPHCELPIGTRVMVEGAAGYYAR